VSGTAWVSLGLVMYCQAAFRYRVFAFDGVWVCKVEDLTRVRGYITQNIVACACVPTNANQSWNRMVSIRHQCSRYDGWRSCWPSRRVAHPLCPAAVPRHRHRNAKRHVVLDFLSGQARRRGVAGKRPCVVDRCLRRLVVWRIWGPYLACCSIVLRYWDMFTLVYCKLTANRAVGSVVVAKLTFDHCSWLAKRCTRFSAVFHRVCAIRGTTTAMTTIIMVKKLTVITRNLSACMRTK
jgi:hypothetical protein